MPPDSKSVAIIIRRVRGKRIITFEDLLHSDVIISTSTFDWSDWVTKRFEFQRVVVDESHLFATAPSSARLEKTSFAKVSSLRWCVTATPFVPSVAELKKQLVFLFGGFGQYHNYETLSIALRGFSGSKRAFYTLVGASKSNVHGSPYQVAAYQWIAGSCSSSIYDDNHVSRCECTRTQVVWSCTLLPLVWLSKKCRN
jgi:hypothetical protein